MTRTLQELMDSATTLEELNALSMTDEFGEAVEASIDSFEPSEEDFALSAVRAAAHRRAIVEKETLDAVRAAREARLSWNKIGAGLHTSGEAARQRYRDLVA